MAYNNAEARGTVQLGQRGIDSSKHILSGPDGKPVFSQIRNDTNETILFTIPTACMQGHLSNPVYVILKPGEECPPGTIIRDCMNAWFDIKESVWHYCTDQIITME